MQNNSKIQDQFENSNKMISLPKVSVITPSFNQGEFLEQTIISVLNQSYSSIEHIVVDGGSQDNSVEILNRYESKLSYWISEEDKGQSDAINKGIRQSTGEIFTWLNSDDQLMPEAITQAVELFLANPEVAVVHGKTLLFKGNGWEQVKECQIEGLPYRYLSGMCFPQPSSFVRKSALDAIGLLDESLHYGMDYDFFVRLALNFDFLRSEEIYSKYLLHDESKSTTANLKFAEDWAKVFSKVLRSFSFTDELINILIRLEIYDEGRTRYEVTKAYSKESIEKAFLFFLGYQLTFRYEGLDLSGVNRIGHYLYNHHGNFLKDQKFLSMYRRSFLPQSLIQIMRKLIR